MVYLTIYYGILKPISWYTLPLTMANLAIYPNVPCPSFKEA